MIEKGKIISIYKFKANYKKNKEMFDLETEKNHNFFADGILVHNSGTVRRSDGNDMFINAVVGDIIYELPAEQLIKDGLLMSPNIVFIKKYLNEEEKITLVNSIGTGLINEQTNYPNIYKICIVNNEKRNDIIKSLIEKNKDKKILILVKLIEHGQLLSTLLNVPYLYGDLKSDIRDKMMSDFRGNENNILISTISILQEGIDIPSLQVLINVSANKSDIRSIQSLGRVLRKNEGKEDCIYYDFIDDVHRILYVASRSRVKAFEKEGHEVVYKDLTTNE